jgi:hypothetical protein
LSRIDPERPLTNEAEEAAAAQVDAAEAEVRGLMVATQTCDLIRRCEERPFVEVCPLVEVDGRFLEEIRRARRPNFAYVPGVAEHDLVADLDRVMSVEKAVVARWERIEGCNNEGDVRRLALALSRKRRRFAFPDDFVALAGPLQNRLVEKHDKRSDEGRALRALSEIRVRAAPSWDSGQVELTFWFIRTGEDPTFESEGWNEYCEAWLNRLTPKGRFIAIDGVVLTLDDLSARDYVESDPLDLDNLSTRPR